MDITLIQDAVSAIKAGNKATGRKLLEQAIQSNPQNETAWLWLAVVQENPARKKECLQRALKINPNNATAKQGLAQLEMAEINIEEPSLVEIVSVSPATGAPSLSSPNASVPVKGDLKNPFGDIKRDIPYWLCFIWGSIIGGLAITLSINEPDLGTSISHVFLLAAFIGLSIFLGIIWLGILKPDQRWSDVYKIPLLAWGAVVSYIIAFFVASQFDDTHHFVFLLCGLGILNLIRITYSFKRARYNRQKTGEVKP